MRRLIMFPLDVCITREYPLRRIVHFKAPISFNPVFMFNKYKEPLVVAEVDNETPLGWHLFTSYIAPRDIYLKSLILDISFDIEDGARYLGTMPGNKRGIFCAHVYYLGLADPDHAARLDSEEELQDKTLE